MRIAVIGSGISGNGAAYALAQHHEVVVYEKATRIGGHAATVTIDYDGTAVDVDTGFIVYNTLNYHHLTALFEHLGVPTASTTMGFAVSLRGGDFEWAGSNLNTVFGDRRRLIDPAFWQLLMAILRFNKVAQQAVEHGIDETLTLDAWLDTHGFPSILKRDYLYPMVGAIWSMRGEEVGQFTAKALLHFFNNHRLLHSQRPTWRTVVGGSRTYVDLLLSRTRALYRTGVGAVCVRRDENGVLIKDSTGAEERFDQIVLACHTDEALAMLVDATDTERTILSAIRYRENDVYLHRDLSLMPKRRRTWAAWNVLAQGNATDTNAPICVSYWMNALQPLATQEPLIVTLDPIHAPREDLTFGHYRYAHPQYDAAAYAAQLRVPEIQGQNRTWFAGAWTANGFHEDGLRSAALVAEGLSVPLPWAKL
jgi:uncharacterized protein